VTDLAKLAGSFPTFNTDEVAEMTETDKDGLTLGSRLKLLEVAFDVIRRECQVFVDRGRGYCGEALDLALLHRALHIGSDQDNHDGSENGGIDDLNSRISSLQCASRLRKDEGENGTLPPDLVKVAINFMIKEVPKLMLAQKIASVDAWIESHDDSHELHQVAVKASNVFFSKTGKIANGRNS
jgi:hypothetical protein